MMISSQYKSTRNTDYNGDDCYRCLRTQNQKGNVSAGLDHPPGGKAVKDSGL